MLVSCRDAIASKNLFITRLSFNIYNTYIESSPGIESRCIYIQYLSQILVNLGLVITISWRDPNDDDIPIKKDSHWNKLRIFNSQCCTWWLCGECETDTSECGTDSASVGWKHWWGRWGPLLWTLHTCYKYQTFSGEFHPW